MKKYCKKHWKDCKNLLNYESLKTELQVNSIYHFKEFYELFFKSKVIMVLKSTIELQVMLKTELSNSYEISFP